MIDLLHIGLAYAGMVIHILVKYEKVRFKKDFKLRVFLHTISVPTLINIISIPIILILMGDSSLADVLPINNVTSVLAGYQTQSIFKSLMDRANIKQDE